MIKKNLLLVGALSLGILGSAGNTVSADEISTFANDAQKFTNFNVTYSGAEKFAPYSVKKDASNAVVNLASDTGTAWITATMKNSEGAYRGGTNVQRGTRATFPSVNAQVNYKYKLGLRKTNNTGGGSVTISGTWAASNN